LAEQYGNTFEALKDDKKFIMIKGANNYDCSALSQPSEPQQADSCAWFTMVKSNEFSSVINEHCNKCEYLNTKKLKNTVRHITTNYSYFFIDRMYTGKFESRDLVIWDEAHLLNDLFSEHNAIYFSQKRMQSMAEEISENIRITDVEIAKIIKSVSSDCGIKDKINDSNYETYMRALMKVYAYARDAGNEAAENSLRSGKADRYSKLVKFTKKYEGLFCKIDDFFKYQYDHVFEAKEDEAAVSVKPVFVGTMMEALQASDKNLFMSATLSDEFLTTTLMLDPEKTKFIKLGPTFSKENKQIVFFDPLSLNYTSLQNPETGVRLGKNVAKIVKKHLALKERGIILTPSFKLQSIIVESLQPFIKSKQLKLFEHRQGEKLADVLIAFKSYQGDNAVLISPSMFEGVDLPDDMSRFQVLVKAPFPSLGDKRMKFILDKHNSIYSLIALMKLVQGAGRSVRSIDDHAVTYVLDKNAERLWTSKANIWKDEFSQSFTSFI
jgi:Rad3-related DNA helicase